MQSGTHAERAERGRATVEVIRRHAQAATRAASQQPLGGVVVSTKGYQGHFVPTSIYGVADAAAELDQTGVDLASELLQVCARSSQGPSYSTAFYCLQTPFCF